MKTQVRSIRTDDGWYILEHQVPPLRPQTQKVWAQGTGPTGNPVLMEQDATIEAPSQPDRLQVVHILDFNVGHDEAGNITGHYEVWCVPLDESSDLYKKGLGIVRRFSLDEVKEVVAVANLSDMRDEVFAFEKMLIDAPSVPACFPRLPEGYQYAKGENDQWIVTETETDTEEEEQETDVSSAPGSSDEIKRQEGAST